MSRQDPRRHMSSGLSQLVEYGDESVKWFEAPGPGTGHVPAVAAGLTDAFDDTGMLTFEVDTRREL